MENPTLGLAYVKTAAWYDDLGAMYRRVAPTWLGGDPATPPTPLTPAQQAEQAEQQRVATEQQAQQQAQVQAQQQAAANAAPVKTRKQQALDKRKAAERAKRQALIKQRAAMLEYERGPRGAADREQSRIVAKDISDARIAREGDPTKPEFMGNEPARAREQARREAQGNWAWENSRGLAMQRQNPYKMPGFGGGVGMRGGGAAAHKGESAVMGDVVNASRSAIAPGMTNADFVAGTNRFLDTKRLEGQGASGMGLDEFDRYMARYYPEAQKASRERYAKPEIASGASPAYQWQGRSNYGSKKPISWEPTTYEQAQRMGVLGHNGLLRSPADPLANQPKPPPVVTPEPAPVATKVPPVKEFKAAQAALGDGAPTFTPRNNTGVVGPRQAKPIVNENASPLNSGMGGGLPTWQQSSYGQAVDARKPAPAPAPAATDDAYQKNFEAWHEANKEDAPLAVPRTNTGWQPPARTEVTEPLPPPPPAERVSEKPIPAMPVPPTGPARSQRNMTGAGISASLTPEQQARLDTGAPWRSVGKPRQTLQEWYSNPQNVQRWSDFVNEGRPEAKQDGSWLKTYDKYYRQSQPAAAPTPLTPEQEAQVQAPVAKPVQPVAQAEVPGQPYTQAPRDPQEMSERAAEEKYRREQEDARQAAAKAAAPPAFATAPAARTRGRRGRVIPESEARPPAPGRRNLADIIAAGHEELQWRHPYSETRARPDVPETPTERHARFLREADRKKWLQTQEMAKRTATGGGGV